MLLEEEEEEEEEEFAIYFYFLFFFNVYSVLRDSVREGGAESERRHRIQAGSRL